MTSDEASRILGALRSENGVGIVRIETHFDTGIDDVWAALTQPARLARWYGKVEGDLRPGGELRLQVEASGWEGTGRVEACEPPRRLSLTTRETDESWQSGVGAPPFDEGIEVLLSAEDDGTVLVVELRGLPLDMVAAYGVGWQIHVEDLADHVAGREPAAAEARWKALAPAYQQLATGLGE